MAPSLYTLSFIASPPHNTPFFRHSSTYLYSWSLLSLSDENVPKSVCDAISASLKNPVIFAVLSSSAACCAGVLTASGIAPFTASYIAAIRILTLIISAYLDVCISPQLPINAPCIVRILLLNARTASPICDICRFTRFIESGSFSRPFPSSSYTKRSITSLSYFLKNSRISLICPIAFSSSSLSLKSPMQILARTIPSFFFRLHFSSSKS